MVRQAGPLNRRRSAIAASAALLLGDASAGATLPYRSGDMHLGVASCASSVCHGSVRSNPNYEVPLNEYVTWSHRDMHSKAYQALTGERGRSIAAKLGIASAENAKECLDCHSDNVPPALRGRRFALSDGIGCEACHGGAERWIASHSTARSGYRADVKQGMYPSADLRERAMLCESCHVGNADKFASHRIMGAGHPRLSFELDTYLALQPPHYATHAAYRRRKPAYTHAQTWAAGQLQGSVLQLDLLQAQPFRARTLFPELALFNCASCHDSSMQHPEWRRSAMTQLMTPGTVPLNDAYWRMSWLIVRAVDQPAGSRILTLAQSLQRSAATTAEQIAPQARELRDLMQRSGQRLSGETWSPARTASVLQSVLKAGSEGEFRDYLGSEQAVMAVELLLIDGGQAPRLRPQLDELYGIVKDDRAFRSADLAAALKILREKIAP